MNTQETMRQSDQFPCPACGGQMTYDPEAGTLRCAYCEKTLTIDTDSAEILEYDLETGLTQTDQDWGQATQVIRCESCGAQTVLEANSVSQFCSFCGSAHVVRIDEMAGIKPESLVPFKVARPKAESLFTRWIGRKWLAPRSLKQEYSPEKLKGIYVPFWTYDAATHSTYTAEAGTYYYTTRTRTVTQNGKTRTVTEQVRHVRWRWVSGTYAKAYDDLLINAASHMQGGLIRKIEPFDLRELIPYRPEYLAGFGAERYSIGLQQGFGSAKDIIRQDLYGDIHRQIHADTVRNSEYPDHVPGRPLQASAPARLDIGLPLPQKDLSVPDQRPDRRGPGARAGESLEGYAPGAGRHSPGGADLLADPGIRRPVNLLLTVHTSSCRIICACAATGAWALYTERWLSWSKAHDWKSCLGLPSQRGFESLSLRQKSRVSAIFLNQSETLF